MQGKGLVAIHWLHKVRHPVTTPSVVLPTSTNGTLLCLQRFAAEASRSQITLDLFAFSPGYTDLASWTTIPRYTCGQVGISSKVEHSHMIYKVWLASVAQHERLEGNLSISMYFEQVRWGTLDCLPATLPPVASGSLCKCLATCMLVTGVLLPWLLRCARWCQAVR